MEATLNRQEELVAALLAGPSRVLMVKTHALGDVLMTTPAVDAFRASYPRSSISYLTTSGAAPLLEHQPAIDEVHSFPASALFERQFWQLVPLLRRLRKQPYDLAICFQQSPLLHGLLKLGGVGRLVALSSSEHNPFLDQAVAWHPREPRPAAAKFADLVRLFGASPQDLRPRYYPTLPEKELAATLLGSHFGECRRVVLLCPGGGANMRDTVLAKRWPTLRFAALGRMLEEECGCRVGLLSGPGERAVAEQVRAQANRDWPLLDALRLRDAAAVLGEVSLVVTNDSLPLHLAMSQHTPVLGLFGPSDAAALLPDLPGVAVVASQLSCSPCYANEPFPGCVFADQQPRCMDHLPVEAAYRAARRLLGFAG